PRSTLFPYTTLFRSDLGRGRGWQWSQVSSAQVSPARREEQAASGRALEPPGSPGFVSHPAHTPSLACEVAKAYATVGRYSKTNRSEEHTSELQSLAY